MKNNKYIIGHSEFNLEFEAKEILNSYRNEISKYFKGQETAEAIADIDLALVERLSVYTEKKQNYIFTKEEIEKIIHEIGTIEVITQPLVSESINDQSQSGFSLFFQKKIVKRALVVLLGIVSLIVLIAGVGIIKFNIMQDDIYYAQPDGSSIQANEIVSTETFEYVCPDSIVGEFQHIEIANQNDQAFLAYNQKIFRLKALTVNKNTSYASINKSVIVQRKLDSISIEVGSVKHQNCSLSVISDNDIRLLRTGPSISYNYFCENQPEIKLNIDRNRSQVLDIQIDDYVHQYKQDIDKSDLYTKWKSGLPYEIINYNSLSQELRLIKDDNIIECSLASAEIYDEELIQTLN